MPQPLLEPYLLLPRLLLKAVSTTVPTLARKTWPLPTAPLPPDLLGPAGRTELFLSVLHQVAIMFGFRLLVTTLTAESTWAMALAPARLISDGNLPAQALPSGGGLSIWVKQSNECSPLQKPQTLQETLAK